MIEHMDNFSIYGTNKALLLNGVYSQATTTGTDFELVADPDGVSPGFVAAFHIAQTNTPILRYALQTLNNVVGWCGRVWLSDLPGDDNHRPNPVSFRDASNASYLELRVESTGRLSVVADAGVYTTPNPVITANGWYHIEVKYDVSGTGHVEVRVEGVSVLSQGFAYAGHGQVYQLAHFYTGSNSGGISMYLKDYVIWNGAGTHNNDFLGSVLVVNLKPTSDIALNWTPSTGANGFSILDNIPPNDAQFITAPNPPPSPYVCGLSDLPPEVTSVKGVMTFVRAAKTDGGDASLQVGVISDAVTVLGANRPITVAQTYWRDIFETDPATTASWLPAAVNAAAMQLNRTA